jgi:hypothetical protein
MKKPQATLLVGIALAALIGGYLLFCYLKRPQPSFKEADTKKAVTVVRPLLEEGQASGSLPADVVVRVHANLFGTDDPARAEAEARGVVAKESLTETWEFASNQVYRVVPEIADNRPGYVYRRVESRPFDSKGLCKDLIDGKALEIKAEKGKGPRLHFVGTKYIFGGRYIQILRNGETVLHLGESCVSYGYAESDARAFAALYERLASQARALFKSKADEAK